MPAEIFVFTAAGDAAQEHYWKTIGSAVPIEEIAEVDTGIAGDLNGLQLESLRCWGSVPGPGNLRSWERMQPGHWAMVYVGQGRFPYLLELVHKARSEELADRLWGRNSEGKTWELMFFFGAFQPVDLSIASVREALGYDDSWWPQGLQYPTPEHQAMLLEKYGSIEAFVSTASDDSSTSTGPPSPTPGEMLLGGEFTGPPTKPPKAREQRKEPDPDAAGRGYLAHEETVAKLANHVGPSFRKGTPGINHDGGWPVNGGFSIAEVKSINSKNEVGQLQKGLGQILHNRFKAERNGVESVTAYLIAERKPANSGLWCSLAEQHNVVFTWPERFEDDIERPPA
jgi:hypothetical protein